MTRKIVSIFTAATFLLCGAASLSYSQTIPNQLADANKVWFVKNPEEWPMAIRPGARAGRDRTQWYTDIFWPFAGTKDTLVFINPKFVWGAKDSNEQNIGTGIRHLMFDENIMVGGNFFYDTRRTEHDNRFHQLGCGMEIFSKWVDLRSNFYYPLSDRVFLDDDITYRFASVSLRRITTSRYEEPLMGYDCELGFLIPFVSNYLETRIFGGWYQYFSDCRGNDFKSEVYGLRTRMEIRPIPALTFGLEITSDKFEMKNTNAYIGGYITVPFNLGSLFTIKNPFEGWQDAIQWKKGPRSLRKRMTDKVIRDIDIVSDDVTSIKDEKEHDMIYVDKASGNNSNPGTLEAPKATIAAGISAVTGDKWVYVKQGGSDYAENVTLANDVTLWGSRYDGGFAGIPTDSGPVINKAGNVVRLASDNTVMGFTITGGTNGVVINDNNDSVTIKHNVITGNRRNVFMECNNGAGESLTNINISNNTISSATGGTWPAGIWLDNYGTVSNLTISSNTITSNGAGGALDGGITIIAENDASYNTSVTISNNTVSSNNTYGVLFYSPGAGTVQASLSRNVITSNTNSGLATAGIVTVDAGGGSLGAEGYNSIYSNTTYDANNTDNTATITAQHNWWGTATPLDTQFNNTVDHTNPLSYDPN